MIDKDQGPRETRNAGGVFIAAGTILGAVLGGLFFNQPSAGLLAGLAAGIILALLLWWRERDRK